jgi:hypothetical protein
VASESLTRFRLWVIHAVLVAVLTCGPYPILNPLALVSVCRRANLSTEVQAWAEEVALDEQGHVRMVRQVRGISTALLAPTACCSQHTADSLYCLIGDEGCCQSAKV